jgi:hypothetical protein
LEAVASEKKILNSAGGIRTLLISHMFVIENHDDAGKFSRFLHIRYRQAPFGNPLGMGSHDQDEIVQKGKIAARHASKQSF